MPKELSKVSVLLVSLTLLLSLTLVAGITGFGQGSTKDIPGDLLKAATGEPVSDNIINQGRFIDIVNSSLFFSEESSRLTLRVETREPIPSSSNDLLSYSFILDLDGDKKTGFVGNRAPLGIFPELGIDLWLNYSLYKGERHGAGYLASPEIPQLKGRTTVVDFRFENDRKVLVAVVSVSQVEKILSFIYGNFSSPWEIKPEEIKWTVFTSWAPLSKDNPISDLSPETYYRSKRTGTILNPLVEKLEG